MFYTEFMAYAVSVAFGDLDWVEVVEEDPDPFDEAERDRLLEYFRRPLIGSSPLSVRPIFVVGNLKMARQRCRVPAQRLAAP